MEICVWECFVYYDKMHVHMFLCSLRTLEAVINGIQRQFQTGLLPVDSEISG